MAAASEAKAAPAAGGAALRQVADLRLHKDRVWCVEWAPSGRALASCGGDSQIRLWAQDASGAWVTHAVLEGVHNRTVRAVAWSPNGKYLASCGFDGLVGVWSRGGGSGGGGEDSSEWECISTLEGHENEVKSVAWAASSTLLATCSRDKSVWVWNANAEGEFECLSVLHDHSQDVKCVRFHPSEECLVSASYDDTIKVWTEEDDDWVCQQTLKAHRSTVWGLAFNRSGDRLVSCSDDRSLMLWRAAAAAGTGVAQWELADTLADAHRRTIFGVSWSRWHGLIASAGADNAVGLFSAAGDKLQRSALVEQAHEADVNCVAWNPSEAAAHLLASAGDDSAVKIWALAQPAK